MYKKYICTDIYKKLQYTNYYCMSIQISTVCTQIMTVLQTVFADNDNHLNHLLTFLKVPMIQDIEELGNPLSFSTYFRNGCTLTLDS